MIAGTISNYFEGYPDHMVIIIALGSNLKGSWGTSHQTLQRALEELASSGIKIVQASGYYSTRAQGQGPQPNYLNAVIEVVSSLPADMLLKKLKRIEAQAGRTSAVREDQPHRKWNPRPLDLDIICYKGIVCNWKMKWPVEGRRLILPHPRAHERAFVLRPLADIAPRWHHPIYGLTAAALLKRPRVRDTGLILGRDEFAHEAGA